MVWVSGCLGQIIALFASTLWELSIHARIKRKLWIVAAELSRSEVAVFFKNPLHSNGCHSTSFYSFPVILSQFRRAHQDLIEDIKVVDREQELTDFPLSKVGLFFEFSQAYSPRPPKEIVAHHHYSPARLTVTGCSTSGWLPFFPFCPFLFKVVKRPLVPEVQHAVIGQPFILELEIQESRVPSGKFHSWLLGDLLSLSLGLWNAELCSDIQSGS